MLAAGIEGGSWNRIEQEWSLQRAEAMYSYWQRSGPPLNVALQVVGQALGIDWKSKGAAPDMGTVAPEGPSIAELALAGLRPL